MSKQHRVSLDEIREKVPTAHHEPRENCKYCGGTGMRHKKIPATDLLPAWEGDCACICIFVDHELADFAQETLNKTIRTIRRWEEE